jgi:thiamine-phosphate diphosphorylase
MRRWVEPSLMLITDRSRLHGRELEEAVSQAVDGGVTCVQLREKDLAAGELYELALTLRAVIQGRALLIINDRVDIACETGADGVHLPERGLPVAVARRMAGDGCIIGRSVHSIDAALDAQRTGADYLLAGSVYETSSHPGRLPAGIDFVRALADAAHIPVLAVGGVTPERVPAAIDAGAAGIAVIGAIMDAVDPKAAASALKDVLNRAYVS